MLPTLPTVSIPVNFTPPASVLNALSQLTAGLPPLPATPPQLTSLFLQLYGLLPPFPTLPV